MIVNNYRHEFKYLVYESQLNYLENEVSFVMQHDSYASNGIYNVRSLYFDDYNNTCFYENDSGTDPREKFRIRIYNASTDRINLECKKKENGKTLKTSCTLSLEQCMKILNKEILEVDSNTDPLINKFIYNTLLYNLHPAVIVDYDRKPYICKEGNVRVTFDTNISSSNSVNSFLEPYIAKRPIMPCGLNLLEVKYDDFLPDIIYNNLGISNLTYTSFSKYYYSRCYEFGHII